MSDLVKIPMAGAEYQVRFERPYLGLITNDKVLDAVVTALLPFKFRLANTEIVTTGTPADRKVILRIPERGITFQFGAEEYRFSKEGSFWATADEDGKVLVAAERALMEESGARVESCTLTIAMHLQPLAKTREEILAPFVPAPFKVLMAQREVQSSGHQLKWADGDVLFDYSVGVANGIFLRLTSHFKGQPLLTDIMAKVRSDEETVFGILGIEEAPNV